MDQFFKGNFWTAQKIEDTFIISIKNQAYINETLSDFISSMSIKEGKFSGIGLLDEATLRFFDPITKAFINAKFDKIIEITDLSGYVSQNNVNSAIYFCINLKISDTITFESHFINGKVFGTTKFLFYPLNNRIFHIKKEKSKLGFCSLNDTNYN